MSQRDAFSACHPAVCFLYFALVLGFGMVFLHPLCLAISLGCALAYSAQLDARGTLRAARWMLPTALAAALLNPAFNHAGVTILAYLPSGNPLTLESILYGLAAAGMLMAILLWFRCCTAVLTSDKFVYLFGRVIPALSLVLSMTLRFVPSFRTRLHSVTEAQRALGRDAAHGPLRRRAKIAVGILSILVTWALENAVATADSMRCRGYGLPGRTAFSLYRLDGRDRSLLIWLGTCGAYILCGAAAGGLRFAYYPLLHGSALRALTVSFYAAYLALCLTPVILNRREALIWKRLRSEI